MTPTLTSIEHDAERVGYLAAQRLDQLMTGESAPAQDIPILVPPRRLVIRDSTSAFVTDDPRLARIVAMMESRFKEGIDVNDVVQTAGVSRRWLERHFTDQFECTPHVFLSRLRIQLAKSMLLLNPRPSLDQIRSSCGFSDVRNLHAVFQRTTGETIKQYLANH